MQGPVEAQTAVTVRTFAQRLSPTRRGARLARLLAVQQLGLWGLPWKDELSDDVAAVVAELAANAVTHGRVWGRDFELRLLLTADALRVEVSDTHDGMPTTAPAGPPDADAESGRGLLVVTALAARWGVNGRLGPGKTLWAEIDL